MTVFAMQTMAGGGTNTVASRLRSATVFRAGAELVHEASAELAEGNNELVIDDLSNNIEPGSIRVGCSGDVTILSATFALEFLKPESSSPMVKRLKDSIAFIKNEQAKLDILTKSDNELLDLLRANKEIRGSQTGLNVAELEKMMDYYKQRSLNLLMELNGNHEKRTKLDEIVDKLENQVKEEENKNTRKSGSIILQLISPVAGNTSFTITYITPDASWTPFYDLKADNTHDPLRLMYKARLSQTSGIDWKQIRLTLSTALPNEKNIAPLLQPWFLGFIDPLAFKMAPVTNSLQEVVVVRGYSSLMRKEDDEEKDKSLDTHVAISEHSLNTSFDIDIPYTIPGNGKEQDVAMKELKVPCIYQYYAAPGLDQDVYLLSKAPDWEKLDLLPGEANITVEGTYIGKSNIDPHSAQDTLNLTLGRDKRIVVKREKLAEYSSVKFLGANRKQVFTYEITVRNNKKEKIELLLKDQYPISTNKEIEAELLQSSGAEVNTETGLLSWKMELAPGESKKYRISYSIKYPKDKNLNLN